MIFLSDLDRTLIFSYNRLSPDNFCVEEMDGKKLSFMTHRSAELFGKMVNEVRFIPVTTRSMNQYRRIKFPDGFMPELAVADNSGNLLVNDVPDSAWREEFDTLVNSCRHSLEQCRAFLEKREEIYLDIRMVDDTFLYTKSHTPEETAELMRSQLELNGVDIFTNGDKLYAIPRGIGKEAAVRKIRARFPNETIVAAGDSLFDIGMLSAADIAIVKGQELADINIPSECIRESGDDPDFTLTALEKLIAEKR